MFERPTAKLWIGSVDDPNLTLEAQYNPKELQIDSPMKWQEHDSLDAQAVANKPMEFGGMGAETMKLELFFDAYESNDRNYVVSAIDTIKRLATVRSQYENRGELRRPHFCVVAWGENKALGTPDRLDGRANFACVIESVSVKYTMFSPDGAPLRATVTVSLKSGRRPEGVREMRESQRLWNARIKADNKRAEDALVASKTPEKWNPDAKPRP